ncbi:hypothetical protein FDUTEX481_06697 [Tolypothrix sp. PCC 7601]|nr:hypothetical protein FDUTEX481_06697 [Tolypothrix sp. PCC 7601]
MYKVFNSSPLTGMETVINCFSSFNNCNVFNSSPLTGMETVV